MLKKIILGVTLLILLTFSLVHSSTESSVAEDVVPGPKSIVIFNA